MNSLKSLVVCSALAVMSPAFGAKIGSGKYPFPVYRNAAPGKQVGGVRSAAANQPIPAAEAQKKFTLPDGFEIRLFASEPAVVNPVTMTWDTRGRLWVLELYEYPMGAKPGQKPRDRIKILEDTDADGVADKVHVWADGLNLGTGLLLGNGGAYVGAAPNMWFLRDTDGDDRADFRKPVMSGFGTEDRHELLNGFTWGPDGYLYMTHGVFTRSHVFDPDNPETPEVYMDAAVARWHPQTKRFEVFADGTSNPWGVDFDYAGNAFISACVIDHMWHLAPGGQYLRQGGTWKNPYGYADMHSKRGGLPSIVDHRHHLAAYCGVQIYQGDQYPAEHVGTVVCGNIHDNAVHQDILKPNGSSFTSHEKQDFVRANDGWFRTVSQQVGPDGAIWLADWYDKYPCYQNARADPAGVDREHGRIWRVVYTGEQKGKPVASRPSKDMNLAKLPSDKLVKLLAHKNVWHREWAQRLLTERSDRKTKPALLKIVRDSQDIAARLQALWTTHASGLVDDALLDELVDDKAFEVRTWVARISGERQTANAAVNRRLQQLATDKNPSVRLAVATALRQQTSGQLTVNTRPSADANHADVLKILTTVVNHSRNGQDPLIPFLVWMAAEPIIANNPARGLAWLRGFEKEGSALGGHLTHKGLRRIADLPQIQPLNLAIRELGEMSDSSPLLVHALRGMRDGLKGRTVSPGVSTAPLINRLLKHPNKEIQSIARALGAQWGNAAAVDEVLAKIDDRDAPLAERIKAVQSARQLKNKTAYERLTGALGREGDSALDTEIIRALMAFGSGDLPDVYLDNWRKLSPRNRAAAAEAMASRARWASTLLTALEQKRITKDDIPLPTVRTLMRQPWDFGMLAKRAELIFGRVRAADQDKAALIAKKKRMILAAKGKPDLKRGAELARLVCFTCHKLHNEGTDLEVGPNLTGAGRSSLEALLSNIIDPNQVIGAGYEMTEIVTRDDQSFSGRIIEDSATRVRLLAAGPREETIDRQNIKSMKTSELSLMPDGLVDQLSDADLRHLVGYLLNPPGDKAPFSWKSAAPVPQAGKKAAAKYPRIDWESVAHWNPAWRVVAPEFEGTPQKMVSHAGRNNVLRIHPYTREKASGLERQIDVPAKGRTTLTFNVSSGETSNWELRVLINGKRVHTQTVDRRKAPWQQVAINLTEFAGQKIQVRLENAANNWSWEFGYWSDIKTVNAALTQRSSTN